MPLSSTMTMQRTPLTKPIPTIVLGVFWLPFKDFADQSLRVLMGG